MARIMELAEVCRSKNAGPFMITIDVIFENKWTYEKVKATGVLTKEIVARLYNLNINNVYGIYFVDDALAIKISIWKPHPAGDPLCTDVLGAHYHVPILNLEIPEN